MYRDVEGCKLDFLDARPESLFSSFCFPFHCFARAGNSGDPSPRGTLTDQAPSRKHLLSCSARENFRGGEMLLNDGPIFVFIRLQILDKVRYNTTFTEATNPLLSLDSCSKTKKEVGPSPCGYEFFFFLHRQGFR